MKDAAIKKRKAFDRTFNAERGYVLAYQDARIARQILGSDQDFVLKSYKEWLGRSYSRLTLYLSPISKLEEVQEYGIAMGTPFAVTVANAFMYLHEKDIVERYSSYLILYNRFINDILAIWNGPKDTLLEFLDTLGSKTDRIKLTYCISDGSISFLDLFLYRDISSNVLHFSTFQKPLNKYLYLPFESFHPSSNKKAFIKGELMRYARNSSSFVSFAETREKFWKSLRVRGYPFRFWLPLFHAIRTLQ